MGSRTGQAAPEVWKFLSQTTGGCPFNPVHNLIQNDYRQKTGKQVNMVRMYHEFALKFLNNLGDQFNQDRLAILGTKDKLRVDIVNSMSCFVGD
jgi:hypothetical protein